MIAALHALTAGCPRCNTYGSLSIEWRDKTVPLVSLKPPTLFHDEDQSTHVIKWPWVTCSACGAEFEGKNGRGLG